MVHICIPPPQSTLLSTTFCSNCFKSFGVSLYQLCTSEDWQFLTIFYSLLLVGFRFGLWLDNSNMWSHLIRANLCLRLFSWKVNHHFTLRFSSRISPVFSSCRRTDWWKYDGTGLKVWMPTVSSIYLLTTRVNFACLKMRLLPWCFRWSFNHHEPQSYSNADKSLSIRYLSLYVLINLLNGELAHR